MVLRDRRRAQSCPQPVAPCDAVAVHVLGGLRLALLLLLVGAAVSAVAALVWLLAAGGVYRPKLGLALMVVAGLLCLTGGLGTGRLETADARAFLGAGPERDEPSVDGALTGIGIFLLVALPLLVVGGIVYGRG